MPKRFESSTKLREAHDHTRWPQLVGLPVERAYTLSATHWQTVLIIEEQVDPKTVQEILRHASSGITMDIYTHTRMPKMPPSERL